MPRLAVPITQAFAAAERQARSQNREYAVTRSSRPGRFGIWELSLLTRNPSPRDVVGVVCPDGTRRPAI